MPKIGRSPKDGPIGTPPRRDNIKDLGLQFKTHGRPVPFHLLKAGLNNQNGAVKIVKPADPELLKKWHESEDYKHDGKSKGLFSIRRYT